MRICVRDKNQFLYLLKEYNDCIQEHCVLMPAIKIVCSFDLIKCFNNAFFGVSQTRFIEKSLFQIKAIPLCWTLAGLPMLLI